MKKVQAFKCFCLISSLFYSTAYAEFDVVRADGTNVSSDGSTTVRSTSPSPEREVEYTGSERNCSRTKNYAPFKLFRKLLSNPNDFKISTRTETAADGKLQVRVTMPPYYNECLDLKFVPIKAKGQTLHIRMKMVGENDTYKKYIECLKSSPSAENPVLDGGRFISSRSTISDTKEMLFDLDIDSKKDVKVYFDSPYPTEENGSHSYVWGEPKDVVSCFKSEDFQEGGYTLFESPVTKAAKRAYAACMSNNPLRIAQSIEDVGNATDLSGEATKWLKILSNKLESSRADREKEIFEEIDAIASEFKELKKEGYKEEDEDLARENAKKVVSLLEELDEISIHPSIKTVEALLEQRKRGDITSEERDKIDDEIKRLNTIIGKFDRTKRKELEIIFGALKEYALVDQAFDIEGFRLKSDLYNKVHKDRRTGDIQRKPMLTLSGAADRVKRNLKKFETRTGDWEDAYLAKRGYKEPLAKTQKQYEYAVQRFKNDERKFKENEAKLYKKYCQPSFVMFNQAYHQRRCMKYQQGRATRMQKYVNIRQKQLGYIKSRKGQYDQLNAWYSSAIQRQAAEYQDEQDPFGFYSYTPGGDLGVEADFSLGIPTAPNMAASRGPASQGVPGYPVLGPMGGQNPYAGMQARQGFVPQQGYFNGSYRGY